MKKTGVLLLLLLMMGGLWKYKVNSQPLSIVVNEADYTRTISGVLSINLQGQLENLGPLIQINYSDYVRYLEPEYPLALVGDITPPEVERTQFIALSSTTGRLTVELNEFSTATLHYGEAPLAYTHVLTHSLYQEVQVFLLEGLSLEENYYYRIDMVDLSGNPATSPEYNFIFLLQNFLPWVTRE